MPVVDGMGTHGGYCGPAVKPIALRMVGEIARDPGLAHLPISGMGGIETWRDAAEFLAMGASALQVCTAAMHYGFRIVQDMIDGLSAWMDEKGYQDIHALSGRAVRNYVPWNTLNLKFRTIAHIDQERCVAADCAISPARTPRIKPLLLVACPVRAGTMSLRVNALGAICVLMSALLRSASPCSRNQSMGT